LAYNTTLSVHIKRQTDRGYHEHWTVRLSTGMSDFEVVTLILEMCCSLRSWVGVSVKWLEKHELVNSLVGIQHNTVSAHKETDR
jgi:hypothetical protein